MTFPLPIVTDSIGNLYVGAIWSSNVSRRTPDGTTVQVMDATGDGVHPLDYTCGIAVDANDNVHVLGSDGVFQLDPGGTVTRFVPFKPLACGLGVAIDIKPGSGSNPVNLRSRGVVPTAILGSSSLRVDQIDVDTLAFGPAHAAPAHDPGNAVTRAAHTQDVNADGFPDLMIHFAVQETGITCGDTGASLSGALHSGTTFEGTDTITPLGCK